MEKHLSQRSLTDVVSVVPSDNRVIVNTLRSALYCLVKQQRFGSLASGAMELPLELDTKTDKVMDVTWKNMILQ